MRPVVKIKKINESFVQITAPINIENMLVNHFTFYVPGYRFMPLYKADKWDGTIKLFSIYNGYLYHGLAKEAIHYLQSLNVDIQVVKNQTVKYKSVPGEDIDKWLETLKLPFEPFDHQVEYLKSFLRYKKQVLVCPTGSGKSFAIYLILKYLLDNIFEKEKILIIVPNTNLVLQMQENFNEYDAAYNEFADKIHIIMSGKEKHSDKQIFISTWQSIYKLPLHYFNEFTTVIVDEVHHAKAKSITKIMEKCTKAFYKLGTTGTMDEWKTHKMVIEGLFGSVKTITTTRKLIQKQLLSPLFIENHILSYPAADRNLGCSLTYPNEINYILNHTYRNNLIVNITGELSGNTLVLFYRIKHGQLLYEKLCNLGYDAYYIAGSVGAEDRERIRKSMENKNGAIIVASFQTYSAGVDIRKLHNIVLAAPTKSKIRILQSIGRGLRVHPEKEKLKIIDIIDDMVWQERQNNGRLRTFKNHSYRHYLQRVKIYNNEGFEYIDKKVVIP